MSEIDDNRDEIIRLQSRSDFRRSQEVFNKLTSVAKLLPMHFNEALPDTFASKSSDFEFSTKHDPIMVRHQVGNGVPHFFPTASCLKALPSVVTGRHSSGVP